MDGAGPLILLSGTPQWLGEVKGAADAQRQEKKSSQFTGVTLHKMKQQYQAKILLDGKTKHLGWFSTEEPAARAFDRAVLQRDGRCAWFHLLPREGSACLPGREPFSHGTTHMPLCFEPEHAAVGPCPPCTPAALCLPSACSRARTNFPISDYTGGEGSLDLAAVDAAGA